jgi:hypothetical protein
MCAGIALEYELGNEFYRDRIPVCQNGGDLAYDENVAIVRLEAVDLERLVLS